MEILARTGVAAAHCPRSNAFLGCGVSPVPRMMERGVRVGMGTDGLWSSPSLNLFEETLFAVDLHGLDAETGLRLATLEGARALGIEAETGSLEAGKWADLAVIDAGGYVNRRGPRPRRSRGGGGRQRGGDDRGRRSCLRPRRRGIIRRVIPASKPHNAPFDKTWSSICGPGWAEIQSGPSSELEDAPP